MDQKQVKSINIDEIIQKIKYSQKTNTQRVFPIKQEDIEGLCYSFKSLVLGQPMLLELYPPVIVCGDIHGQFQDLLSIFQRIGEPSERSYLFLGDYVDRGKKSLEVFCLLMAYKIKYPLNFFLLRGNHQCCQLNKVYGFYDQCKQKFNVQLFKIISRTFEYLPTAAIIGNRIFCVHGGLSPLLKDLQELNKIKRPVSTRENKLICDLLWADPNVNSLGWENNFERGVSFLYGPNVIDEFLKKHELDLICRSHQVVEEGYQFFNNRTLITIFSAPNYCGQFQNFAGVLTVSSQMVCGIEQLKGSLKSSRKIMRRMTPIKAAVYYPNEFKRKQSKRQNQENISESQQAKRSRKLTSGAFIFRKRNSSTESAAEKLPTHRSFEGKRIENQNL